MLHPVTIRLLSLALALLTGCERGAHPTPAGAAKAEHRERRASLQPEPPAPAPNEQPAPPPSVLEPALPEAPSSAAPSGAALEFPSGELDPLSGPGLQRPDPQQGGAPSETCIQGWQVPARGSRLRKAALDMIRSRRRERFVVVDIRYFQGPEDAEVVRPQGDVERWYVKGYSVAPHGRSQRWLVRRAAVGRGIDAVAPFDSTGYGPGVWKRPNAADESLADPFQRPCDRARAGEKCTGLPRQVLGCLTGT
jgi:hypothetical protein